MLIELYLGRVLTEMRLVKVSNTENKIKQRIVIYVKFIIWVCDKQNYCMIQPISSVIMLLMIAVILGLVLLE